MAYLIWCPVLASILLLSNGPFSIRSMTTSDCSVSCPFTHWPFCSLTRFHEGSRRGRLSSPCLHKGSSATESIRGSVCVTAVLSRGPVNTATTTSKGTPAPSLSGDRVPGVGRPSDPMELCRLGDESVVSAHQKLNGLLTMSDVLQSSHRVWVSAADMIWLYIPFF